MISSLSVGCGDVGNALPPQEKAGEAAKKIKALAGDIRRLSANLCPKETPAIVSNAGNPPIYHTDRRRKTARQRDAFNEGLIAGSNVQPKLQDLLKQFGLAEVDSEQSSAEELRISARAFCAMFPNRFVYVDNTRGLSAGFHLIEGFFRDDQPLRKLVLDDQQNMELDRLWDELYFSTGIAEKLLRGFVFFERSERNFMKHSDFDAIKEEDPTLVEDVAIVRFRDIYLQRSGVIVTGDKLKEHPIYLFFESIRNGLTKRVEQLRHAEPIYLRKLEEFARLAYRRPLSDRELEQLRTFYQRTYRRPGVGVEQAVRASVIRLLVSPHFCYRVSLPPAGDSVKPASDVALASKLSYFLWSSMPDTRLLALAEAGKLYDAAILRSETRRMLKDPKVSAFALEFFGQWLAYRDFLQAESVNREVFSEIRRQIETGDVRGADTRHHPHDSERQASDRVA